MVEKPFKAYENFPTEKKYFPSRENYFSQLGKFYFPSTGFLVSQIITSLRLS